MPLKLRGRGEPRSLYDTFAVVTRRAARLSAATRELISELETHMQAVAEGLDRTR